MFLGQNIMLMSNLVEFFIWKNCGRSYGPRSWWTMMVSCLGDLRTDTFLYKQRLTCFWSEYHADLKSGGIFHFGKLWAELRDSIMVDHDGFMSW